MAGFLESVYFHSPVFFQQMMVAVYGWRWYRRRYTPHFHRLVAEYTARDRWTADQFRSYQEKQLGGLLACAAHAPYYRQVFQQAGLHLAQAPFENLSKLPFLTKEVLRTRPADLLTVSPAPRETMVFKSSGTTGTPTEIYYSPEFHALELAIPAARNLGWAGVDYRQRRVMFGVRKVCRFDQDRPPFWRYSPAEDMAYASIYHLSPRFLPEYSKFLRQYRPAMIMGYPSALYTLARYALENNDLPAPAKAVFTTSETVTDQHREAIEAAWQCRIFDRYGAVENCLFASQCEYGRYHVSPEAGIIEILDAQGRPCPPGVMGEVIATGLQNTLQPLIRYRIGDVARWTAEQSCACRRQMPVIEAVDGRVEDMCYTPDGRAMLRFDTVFKGVDNIREAQVIQKRLDLFLIKVVPAQAFSHHDIDNLKHNFSLHAGDVPVEVQAVNDIPRSPSGKYRAVICELSSDEKPGF
jgi:phenylacetate-CoA ligase